MKFDQQEIEQLRRAYNELMMKRSMFGSGSAYGDHYEIVRLPGDKGYIKKVLARELFEQGLEFITKIKKNMKQSLSAYDRILLRKRAIIETADDLLKNHFQAGHSRHRSSAGFMNNVLTALIAYTFYPTKPEMRGVDMQYAVIAI